MRARLSILLMICMGGCITTPPIMPDKYQLGIPCAYAGMAERDVVLIGSSAADKMADDGNTYTIGWLAMTNVNSDVDDQIIVAANAILATNIWPQYRMHVDLSIDGGATWIRRLGYGVQTPRGDRSGEMVWSPPEDYGLLTTNARLRLVNLDGRIFTGPTNGLPCDIGTNGIRSAVFAIVGAVVDVPTAGSQVFINAPQSITWRQVGGGTTANLYAATPETNFWVATFSNVVNGANTRSIYIPEDFPTAPEMRFAIRGIEFPAIVGYSRTFEVVK